MEKYKEQLIKDLKRKHDQLEISRRGDYESGYNDGYAVCIEDIERSLNSN